MATNAKLKRQIRARQDVTGEPFMEARRRVMDGQAPVEVDDQLWGELERAWLFATEVLFGPQTLDGDPDEDGTWREMAQLGIPRPGLDRDEMGVLVGAAGAERAVRLIRAGYTDLAAAVALSEAAAMQGIPLEWVELDQQWMPYTVDDGHGGEILVVEAHERGLVTAEQACWLLTEDVGVRDHAFDTQFRELLLPLATESVMAAAAAEVGRLVTDGFYADPEVETPQPSTVEGWAAELREVAFDQVPGLIRAATTVVPDVMLGRTSWPSPEVFSQVEATVAPILDGLPPQFDRWRQPGRLLDVAEHWERALSQVCEEAKDSTADWLAEPLTRTAAELQDRWSRS